MGQYCSKTTNQWLGAVLLQDNKPVTRGSTAPRQQTSDMGQYCSKTTNQWHGAVLLCVCMCDCVCVCVCVWVCNDNVGSLMMQNVHLKTWHISINDLILYCRIFIDSIGGLELDIHGSRKRRWTWKEQIEHVHAPPIQPIMFALTRHLAVRIISQEHITLTFSYGINACRFQVGSKLKVTVELSYCQSFNLVGVLWPSVHYIYCCSAKI